MVGSVVYHATTRDLGPGCPLSEFLSVAEFACCGQNGQKKSACSKLQLDLLLNERGNVGDFWDFFGFEGTEGFVV